MPDASIQVQPRIFVLNFNNSEDILPIFSTDLLHFVWKLMISLENHCKYDSNPYVLRETFLIMERLDQRCLSQMLDIYIENATEKLTGSQLGYFIL